MRALISLFMTLRGRLKDVPVRKIGIEMKNPPMAHTLDTDDFCRYLFSLENESDTLIFMATRTRPKHKKPHTHLPPAMAGDEPTSLTAKRN